MTQRLARIGALFLLGATCIAPSAFAARWDTYNNANPLYSVRALPGGIWAASEFGLHRFDPVAFTFTRVAKAPGELASNSVTEVEVDGAGNTWYGTRKGVSVLRANGTWRTLNTFDGLPSDSVTALEYSSLGMWVGTRRGLALFEGFTLSAVWPDGVNPSPFASDVINDIAHVGDSTYVATNNGVYVTKSDEGVVWQRRVTGLGNLTIAAIKGFGNEVWCVAGTDLYRGGQSGTWTLDETGIPATSITRLTARSGQMFAGTAIGVYRWDGVSSWQAVGTASVPANAWTDVDDTGRYWAGNIEGLWRWNGSAWQLFESPGPLGNWVQGLQLVDRTVWFAARDRGVSRFDGTSWRTFVPTAAGGATFDTTFYGAPNVFGLLADKDGTLWAGQWSQGLAHLDARSEPPSFTHYYDAFEPDFDERNTFVWSSARDSSGNRYFGLDTRLLSIIIPIGINRIGTDDSRTNFSPQGGQAMSGPQVRAIAFPPGPGFEMWVAYAGHGVDVFTDPTLMTRADHFSESVPGVSVGLLDDDTWAIEIDGDNVWIATSGGLSRYSRATRLRQENVVTQSMSSQGAVHPLSIDAEGGIWLATGSGVFHRRPDRSLEVFTAENSPLLSNDVHSVFADKVTGDIWIGTVLGLNRYSPSASSGDGGTIAQGAGFDVYPNPAFLSSSGTIIRATNLAGPFKGKVYDVHGRVVRELLGNASTGMIWNGDDERGQRVTPGVYFIQVKAGGVTRKSRVLLLR